MDANEHNRGTGTGTDRVIEIPATGTTAYGLPDLRWFNHGRQIMQVRRHVVEKEADRHVEEQGELVEATSAHSGGPAFILLDLLVSKVDGIAKSFLVHAQELAAKLHSAANVDIYRVGAFSHIGSCARSGDGISLSQNAECGQASGSACSTGSGCRFVGRPQLGGPT